MIERGGVNLSPIGRGGWCILMSGRGMGAAWVVLTKRQSTWEWVLDRRKEGAAVMQVVLTDWRIIWYSHWTSWRTLVHQMSCWLCRP